MLTSPARPASFRNSRRLQDLAASNIAYLNAQRYYRRTGHYLNENASTRYVDRMTVLVTLRHAQRKFHRRFQSKPARQAELARRQGL